MQKIKHHRISLRIIWQERMMYMDQRFIYCAGDTEGARFACTYLKEVGLPIIDCPGSHIKHLVLDVPSFGEGGQMRMGGELGPLLQMLPSDVTVYGGNLDHPDLRNHRVVDFLKDENYLAENAYITAECALDVALPYLSVTLRNCPVLVIGWGRIGKCLAQLLKAMGAAVTVAARKPSHRAMLEALGYEAVDTASLKENLVSFRLVYNTVPQPVVSKEQSAYFTENCILIDLASRPGIDHEDVIIARGLPGIHFPESSGKLIARTFLTYYNKEETV